MTEEQDIQGVSQMIEFYCKHKHKDKIEEGKKVCPECEELIAYVAERRHKCPFGDDKPFCANCVIHCYKPEMREKIRAVMRYAAPRVTFVHPVMAWKHVSETIKTARHNKKLDKKIKEEAKALGVPFEELKKKKAIEIKQRAIKEARAKQAMKAEAEAAANKDKEEKTE